MNCTHMTAALLTAAALLLGACGGSQPPAGGETALEHAQEHFDREYQCPMHPDVTSDAPGQCPICGMDLVEVRQVQPRQGSPLFYRHPHNPSVTSPTPRKDEMGMDFVPVYADSPGGDGSVLLSPAMVNNLGVRTASVRRGALSQSIETVGAVAYDERGRVEVRVRVDGFVERLAVRAEGEPVRRGQALFAVFSPRLAAAQREFVHALDLGEPSLVAASMQRLQSLGLDAASVARLRETRSVSERVTYHAPVDGVVLMLGIRDGGLAEPGMSAMTIAPVDRYWVVAEVPEADAARVRAGAPAAVSFTSLPGEHFVAEVLEVLPGLNEATRTLQARLEVGNAGGRLRAGMLADVRIQGEAGEPALLVPAEALIRTGRSERVMVALGGGRYAAREVVAGRGDGEQVEIQGGLAEGDQVVVSGQFMIDSESQVRGAVRRFEAAGTEGGT